MQTAGSGPVSPSTAIFSTLPVTASGHPGNLGLSGADFAEANLVCAFFLEANLTKAILFEANLSLDSPPTVSNRDRLQLSPDWEGGKS